jgi:hypothetical protein
MKVKPLYKKYPKLVCKCNHKGEYHLPGDCFRPNGYASCSCPAFALRKPLKNERLNQKQNT